MQGLIVDSFAGLGGASLGIERAIGRSPDIAINHNPVALALHAANHPETVHLTHDVWKVNPVQATGGKPVAILWASPDCKHYSKAKGGKPREKGIRDLAWVVVRWAKSVRPTMIFLENVEEFRDWGPLSPDGGVDPARKGQTFADWVGKLERAGYRVEHRELRACDYGAATIRKRLYLVARRDGKPIVWPKPTHGDPKSADVQAGRLKPWRTAAEILDWRLPCPSIFLTREEARAQGCNRPLAPATMARIARGVKRYVLDAAEPFIVGVAHGESRSRRVYGLGEPIPTIVPAGNGGSLAACFLAQNNTGVFGHDTRKPLSTVVGKGCTQSVVACHILNMKGSDQRSADAAAPLPTACAEGNHLFKVGAFFNKYYGCGDGLGRRPVQDGEGPLRPR